MALLFADSYDHYESADLSLKYAQRGTHANIVPNGRCGTNCLQCDPQLQGFVTKGVANIDRTRAIWGFAVKFVTINDIGNFTTLKGGSPPVIVFARNQTGSISYSINSGAAFPTYTVCTEADLIRVGQWYYIEFKVALSSSAGSIEIHLNGEDRTLPGFDSGVGTAFYADFWDGISLHGNLFGCTVQFDDLYVADWSGPAPWNDFLGDVRVEYLQPTANGASQQWGNTGGAAAWNSVDDGSAPDEDTSYISTAAAGDESTFVYEDASLPSGANVFGVQMSFLSKKDEPGDRIIKAVTREAGVNHEGETGLYPSDDNYDYRHTMMQVNPADSAAWSIDDVNNNEFGVRLDT